MTEIQRELPAEEARGLLATDYEKAIKVLAGASVTPGQETPG